MKILLRRTTCTMDQGSRPGFLWSILRWASVHVIHYESKTLSALSKEFCCWATDVGFDNLSLKPFEDMLNTVAPSLSKAGLDTRLCGFEFGTDGYNLMLLLRMQNTNGSLTSGSCNQFFRPFIQAHASPQTSLLIGQTQNEILVGMSHARLPLRSVSFQHVWILAEPKEENILAGNEPLKEVG